MNLREKKLSIEELLKLSLTEDIIDLTEQDKKEMKELLEKLITFGGKAYPLFGNVVILAGGSASGKGFILDKLIGIEGWVFDVDELKTLAIASLKFGKYVKDMLGYDLNNFREEGALKNPENVRILHHIINDLLDIPNKKLRTMFTRLNITDDNRKPNIIFDVTLSSFSKLIKLVGYISDIGYEPINTHIVWVLTELAIAIKQNKNRGRVVPEDILIQAHEQVSETMYDIIKLGDKLATTYKVNGDIIVAFNSTKLDTNDTGEDTSDTGVASSKTGGIYINKADYTHIKEKGKPTKTLTEINKTVLDKIKKYVPHRKKWEDDTNNGI